MGLYSDILTNVGITSDEKGLSGQLGVEGWQLSHGGPGSEAGKGSGGGQGLQDILGAQGAHWSEGVSRSLRALGSQAEQIEGSDFAAMFLCRIAPCWDGKSKCGREATERERTSQLIPAESPRPTNYCERERRESTVARAAEKPSP